MPSLQEMLLKKVGDQPGLNIQEKGHAIIFDSNFLPSMELVGDWSRSGTKQWEDGELEWLKGAEPGDVCQALAGNSDPWVVMAALAEFVVQGDAQKAQQVAQGLKESSPELARYTFDKYFGNEITQALLAPFE